MLIYAKDINEFTQRTEFFAGSMPLADIAVRRNEHYPYYMKKMTVRSMVYRIDCRSGLYLIGIYKDDPNSHTEIWNFERMHTLEDVFRKMQVQLNLDTCPIEIEYTTYL